MIIYEANLDRTFTLPEIKNEYYIPLREDNPSHVENSFRAELYLLLRETVYHRNDCKLINITRSEALRIMEHLKPYFERG